MIVDQINTIFIIGYFLFFTFFILHYSLFLNIINVKNFKICNWNIITYNIPDIVPIFITVFECSQNHIIIL